MKAAHTTEDTELAAHDPETIRRLITNQKHEHMPHAFRAGYGGMRDFNRLVPVLRSMEPSDIGRWLDVIEEVYDTHRQCQPCGCKVLAYQILISEGLLPERHKGYLEQYSEIISRHPPAVDRDFMSEVIESLYHGKEHPNARKHLSWWGSLFETSLRPDEDEASSTIHAHENK
jgi:hypothetical protein